MWGFSVDRLSRATYSLAGDFEGLAKEITDAAERSYSAQGGVVLFRTSRKAPSGLEGRGFPHTLRKARSGTVPYKEAYARDFKKFVRQPTLARIY
jgi:hypothetical protein